MTLHDAWHDFSEHIAFEGPLGVAVQVTDRPDPLDAHTQSMNASVLACISARQTTQPAGASEEDAGIARELARLDARLNVLMELVGRTVLQGSLPEPEAVRFNAIGVSGMSLPDAPIGTTVCVQLYFDACRALPLRLNGHVEHADGSRFVAFDAMDAGTRDALERLVFRHHRHRVAEARRAESVSRGRS